ncbi:sarcosine oxidase subunit delta [Gammaproteobacteria bacterium]|jgi:heterotetrameric sarcosine oxidase delta subunit|nr:sarcosine oxidase subunit delta [Gammaproteobacteria bacterium]
MIQIDCPYCGKRNEDEFVYGGDTGHRRPEDPAGLSDAEWCEYIYSVPNTRGWANETWWHVRGCNRWITIQRNAESNEVRPASQNESHG